jgi:hypothetical protein
MYMGTNRLDVVAVAVDCVVEEVLVVIPGIAQEYFDCCE